MLRFLRSLFDWGWVLERKRDAFALTVVNTVCSIPLAGWSREGRGPSMSLTAATRKGEKVRLRCYPDGDGGVLYDLYVDGLPVTVEDHHRQRKATARLWQCYERVTIHLVDASEFGETPSEGDGGTVAPKGSP